MVRTLRAYGLTYTLIFLNLLAYLPIAIFSGSFIDADTRVLAVFGALYTPIIVEYNEWWRLLSAMFLHGGMTHLLMNMFSLYIVGRGAEGYFDGKSYLAIYVMSGLLGAVASLYMHPESIGVGASGAIFGVFGALAGFFLVFRRHLGSQGKAVMQNFAVIIGLNLFIGLTIPAVDMSAHIAGLATGFLGGVMIAKNRQWFGYYIGVTTIMLIGSAMYLRAWYAALV